MGRRLLHLVLCWWLFGSTNAGRDDNKKRPDIFTPPTSKAPPAQARAQYEAELEHLITQDADVAALFPPQDMVQPMEQEDGPPNNQLLALERSSSASATMATLDAPAHMGTDSAAATGDALAMSIASEDVQVVTQDMLRQLQATGTVEQQAGLAGPRPGLLSCEDTGEWHFLNPYGGLTALVYGGTTPPEVPSASSGSGQATLTEDQAGAPTTLTELQETVPKRRRLPRPLHLRPRGRILAPHSQTYHINQRLLNRWQDTHRHNLQHIGQLQNRWTPQPNPVSRNNLVTSYVQVQQEHRGRLRPPHPRRIFIQCCSLKCSRRPEQRQALYLHLNLCQGMRTPHHRQGTSAMLSLSPAFNHDRCCRGCLAQAGYLWDARTPLPCRTTHRLAMQVPHTRSTTALQDCTTLWTLAEASNLRYYWQKDRILCPKHRHSCPFLCHFSSDCAALDVDHRASPPELSWLGVLDRLDSLLALAHRDPRLNLRCNPRPSPFPPHGLSRPPQADMMAQIFQGWRELTCLRQWVRFCFLAWASLRASADSHGHTMQVESDTTVPAPESRIRITLILCASPAGLTDPPQQVPALETLTQGSGINTTPPSHMVSRNVRARRLQDNHTASPNVVTTSLSTWQEQVAREIDEAVVAMSPPEQVSVLAQLHAILRTDRTDPPTGSHSPVLSHVCRCPSSPSAMTCRLNGRFVPVIPGRPLSTPSCPGSSHTEGSDGMSPDVLYPSEISMYECLQGLIATIPYQIERCVKPLILLAGKMLGTYPLRLSCMCRAFNPWPLQVLAPCRASATIHRLSPWWGTLEYWCADHSMHCPQMSLVPEAIPWPDNHVLHPELCQAETGRSDCSCRTACPLKCLANPADNCGTAPALLQRLIVHFGSIFQHTCSTWSIYCPEVRCESWQRRPPSPNSDDTEALDDITGVPHPRRWRDILREASASAAESSVVPVPMDTSHGSPTRSTDVEEESGITEPSSSSRPRPRRRLVRLAEAGPGEAAGVIKKSRSWGTTTAYCGSHLARNQPASLHATTTSA